MQVCHVAAVHQMLDTRIFHRECSTLRQAGHDVTLIAQAPWQERTIDGIRVIGLPQISRRYQRVQLWQRIVREVERLSPEVVHFHAPEVLLLAPFLRPAKLIYDCHEGYAEDTLLKTWIPAALRYPASRVVGLVEPALARWVDALVVTVDSHAAQFRGTGRPITVLYNFPLPNVLKVQASVDQKTLIHLGTQNRVRGCGILVEAMRLVAKRVPDARLLFVGPFDEPEYKAEIVELAALYGLENTVVLTGQVPYTEVSEWLAQSSVGLVALQDEQKFKTCIPTKLFEYMGSGMPVVSSDLPPARQFMDGLDCGFLVQPDVPQEYAEAIVHLLDHTTEAKRMGENGRRAVEERYNWRTEAVKLVKLYQTLE